MGEPSKSLQSLNQRIESRVQAIRSDREWWPCRRGCDHCCRHLAHPPELSAMEWALVDAGVDSLPAPIRATVTQKISTLLQQIAAGQVIQGTVVCPYLDEQEGACRIYQFRPVACRTYGFFIARDHHQYCEQIEAEVDQRGDGAIVWGNGESICQQVEQLSGAPIPFEVHYHGYQTAS